LQYFHLRLGPKLLFHLSFSDKVLYTFLPFLNMADVPSTS
jgi:hypothetical protein